MESWTSCDCILRHLNVFFFFLCFVERICMEELNYGTCVNQFCYCLREQEVKREQKRR